MMTPETRQTRPTRTQSSSWARANWYLGGARNTIIGKLRAVHTMAAVEPPYHVQITTAAKKRGRVAPPTASTSNRPPANAAKDARTPMPVCLSASFDAAIEIKSLTLPE